MKTALIFLLLLFIPHNMYNACCCSSDNQVAEQNAIKTTQKSPSVPAIPTATPTLALSLQIP
jgi:hypothetical protein